MTPSIKRTEAGFCKRCGNWHSAEGAARCGKRAATVTAPIPTLMSDRAEREALIRGLGSVCDMLQIMEATGGVATAKGERPSQTISSAMQMLDLLGTRCEGRETEIDVLGEMLSRLSPTARGQ